MSLSVGIVGLPNAGPRTTLTCSQILRVCVARACVAGLRPDLIGTCSLDVKVLTSSQ